jgi:hypothetical protein
LEIRRSNYPVATRANRFEIYVLTDLISAIGTRSGLVSA